MATASYDKEYIRRTKKSKAHHEKAKRLIPAGVESNVRFFPPYPFYVKRAQGAYIFDLDGNKIIDYALGYGPMILGHNHPDVMRAAKAQIDKGMMYGTSSDLAIDYVKMVQKAMPSMEMFRFANSGTEATMHPLRVAPGMNLFYPRTADFIGVVGNFRSSKYVSLFKKGIRKYSAIDARSLTGPEFFGGINLSDNSSFWRHGYRAIMVTDTSFFRNPNYHQETDTIDTLDFEKMAEVVRGLHFTLAEM